jgi:hypothetical protein
MADSIGESELVLTDAATKKSAPKQKVNRTTNQIPQELLDDVEVRSLRISCA